MQRSPLSKILVLCSLGAIAFVGWNLYQDSSSLSSLDSAPLTHGNSPAQLDSALALGEGSFGPGRTSAPPPEETDLSSKDDGPGANSAQDLDLYGESGTREAFLEDTFQLVRPGDYRYILEPSRTWATQQAKWRLKGKEHETLPFEELCPGHSATSEQLAAAHQVDAEWTYEIIGLAGEVKNELEIAIDHYLHEKMTYVPAASYKAYPATGRDHGRQKTHTIVTTIQVGSVVWIVDFRSWDYPVLQSKLDDIQGLIDGRTAAVKSALGCL